MRWLLLILATSLLLQVGVRHTPVQSYAIQVMRTVYLLVLLAVMQMTASALTINPDPEGERRQAAYAELNNICIGHLETVTDRASADAAAKSIQNARKKHRIDGRDFTSEKDTLRSMSEKLSRQYFHGSAALAEKLGYPQDDAIIPTPLTDIVLAQLQEMLIQNLCKPGPERQEAHQLVEAQKGLNEDVLTRLSAKDGELISGGPGFTRETAWVVDEEDERKSTFTASQLVFTALGPMHKAEHRKELTDTRRYMVFTLEVIRDGKKYVVKQWCDTTATGRVYSPARRERARKEITEKARELYEALLSISDEETAEDFGEEVLELCEDIHELDRICEADEQVLNHLYDALKMPERERIASHLMHLRESAGAYDEDLREALRKYLDIPSPH